jgi:hypothetical protein
LRTPSQGLIAAYGSDETFAERVKDPAFDEKLSPQQRIQLGLFLDEKAKVEQARGRWGGDAA